MSNPSIHSALAIEVAMMGPQIGLQSQKEDWTGKTDPIERRKLQNRLSQRAHRTRQKKQSSVGVASSNQADNHARRRSPVSDTSPKNVTTLSASRNHRLRCMNGSPRVQALIESFSQHALKKYLQGAPVLAHLPMLVQYNVTTAFARNAELLGVSSEWLLDDAISPFNKLEPAQKTTRNDRPMSLKPTPLQHSVKHHPWLDLFPLPRMRDNFLYAIESLKICDEDDLCHDLCQYGDPTEKATVVVWGDAWDPKNWEVSVSFWRKWGWLICGCMELFNATNYWREKRGEVKLSMRAILKMMEESRPTSLKSLKVEL